MRQEVSGKKAWFEIVFLIFAKEYELYFLRVSFLYSHILPWYYSENCVPMINHLQQLSNLSSKDKVTEDNQNIMQALSQTL